jgi:DNA-binding MarR family transcriptional regulator
MRSKTRSRQENLTELLARANHLLAEDFSAQLKAHGLSATEWRVLAELAERGGMPMMNLGQKVLLKKPTLTKVIDRMERHS